MDSEIKIETATLDADKIQEWRKRIFDLPQPFKPESQATRLSVANGDPAQRLDISPQQESEAARYREIAATTPPKHHRTKQHGDWIAARDGMRLLQIEEAMRRENPTSYTFRELQSEAAKIISRHADEK
jgi:hypothetical protein